jgi:hypothetical protein
MATLYKVAKAVIMLILYSKVAVVGDAEVRVHSETSRVGFVVDEVTLGQVLLGVFLFSSVSIFPPVFHIQSSTDVI